MPSKHPVERLIANKITLYEREIIRREERDNSIAGLATRPGFFACLEGLPADVVEGLREIASRAPAHPEDCINGNGYYSPMPEGEFEATRRRERLQVYWAMRLLREHFFPDRPLPTFAPRIRVGVVSDSTVVDDSVVIFGVEDSYFIRDHPVHCILPSGGLIVTSVAQDRYVKGPGDESGDSIRRRYGRYGLFLETNIRSPSMVPPGTEVWVDRSAASDIPSLQSLESP